MATIRKEFEVDAPAAKVWGAVEDFWAVHERLAPGFVLRTDREVGARIVHFANGTSARELLVACDTASMRLVYSARSERLIHHNASVELVALDPQRCRFIWTSDLLPDALAPTIDSQMNTAVQVMKSALERSLPEQYI